MAPKHRFPLLGGVGGPFRVAASASIFCLSSPLSDSSFVEKEFKAVKLFCVPQACISDRCCDSSQRGHLRAFLSRISSGSPSDSNLKMHTRSLILLPVAVCTASWGHPGRGLIQYGLSSHWAPCLLLQSGSLWPVKQKGK